MPKIKLDTDESIIYFEDPDAAYALEVEVDEGTLDYWRKTMDEADAVQDAMRQTYADACLRRSEEIPPAL